MNYLIEIYKGKEIIKIKKADTIEKIKTFYQEEYPDYNYRVYELTKEEIKKTEISYYRQQELLEKLKEFKEIPELIKQVERLESMLKNDLIIYM